MFLIKLKPLPFDSRFLQHPPLIKLYIPFLTRHNLLRTHTYTYIYTHVHNKHYRTIHFRDCL